MARALRAAPRLTNTTRVLEFSGSRSGYQNVVPQDSSLKSEARDEAQEIAAGRSAATPFALVGVVAFTIAVVVAIVVALAFLVFWLA
jgi:hypothetical protein